MLAALVAIALVAAVLAAHAPLDLAALAAEFGHRCPNYEARVRGSSIRRPGGGSRARGGAEPGSGLVAVVADLVVAELAPLNLDALAGRSAVLAVAADLVVTELVTEHALLDLDLDARPAIGRAL